MMNAYNELYIDDASEILGGYIDYMVNVERHSGEDALYYFTHSVVGREFGSGNPKYIAGCSGAEMAAAVTDEVFRKQIIIHNHPQIDKTPEYWCGWILARYQWQKGIPFKTIYDKGLTYSYLRSRYILHEADETKAFEDFDGIS